MADRERRSVRSPRASLDRHGPSRNRRGRAPLILGVALVGAVALGATVVLLVRPGGQSATAWSRLGTDDVHSLAFVGDDPNRLLYGHHGGILSSGDGGRSWQELATRSDAMSLGAAADGSIVIAGHDVFSESRDGGLTWQEIPAVLPSLDIHGFTRDPTDPARMWAYLATGGLWESLDAGRTWAKIQADNILFPIAVPTPAGTRLFGVMATGLASSDDGGRAWRDLATPELYPMTSLAGTPDGAVLVAGGPGGLARSDDGGATWARLPLDDQVFAVAVTTGGATIGVVTRSTAFFRSDDGGQTWPAP